MTLGAAPLASTPLASQSSILADVELVATSIKFGLLVSDSAIAQIHNVSATGLKFSHAVGTPLLGQNYIFSADNIKYGLRVQEPKNHVFADGIKFGVRLAEPLLEQIHNLDAGDIKFGIKLEAQDAGASLVFVNRAGVWVNPTMYAHHGGVWKQVEKAWVNWHGTWIQVYFGE